MSTRGVPRSQLAELHARGANVDELRTVIRHALEAEKGNVTRASHRLRVSRPFLWYYMRKLMMSAEPAAIRARVRKRFVLPPFDDVAH
jgi:transcriptional regulator with PAS, ATPase and Fis domain